jgi:flavin-binding protein dodecin
MAIAKTIEIIAASNESIEQAIRSGIAKASETVKGIEGAWVKDTKVTVRSGQIAEWRVTLAVTFVVD